MSALSDKIIEIHTALAAADLPHAFGGALALAWCTLRARGTIDIDINIFVPADTFEAALAALPDGIKATRNDRQILKRDGQVRLWWEKTPVDVFLNTTPYHEEVAGRFRWERFAGHDVPFIACDDLAVFKAFFNRTKDWADIEEMQAAGTLGIDHVIAVISHYLGNDDIRVEKLMALRGDPNTTIN